MTQNQKWTLTLRKFNHLGKFDYTLYAKNLREEGFESTSRQEIHFTGGVKSYRVFQAKPCEFFIMKWFLSSSGDGYGWEAWWNFAALRRSLASVVEPALKQYKNA